jgi:hypothetical protein
MMLLLDLNETHPAEAELSPVSPSPQTLRARFLAGELSTDEFELELEKVLALPQYGSALALPVVKFQCRQSLRGHLRHGGLEVTSNRLSIRSGRKRQPERQPEFTFDADRPLLRAIFARPNIERTTRVEFDNYRTELSTTSLRTYPYLLKLYARETHISGPILVWTWLCESELTTLINYFS